MFLFDVIFFFTLPVQSYADAFDCFTDIWEVLRALATFAPLTGSPEVVTAPSDLL